MSVITIELYQRIAVNLIVIALEIKQRINIAKVNRFIASDYGNSAKERVLFVGETILICKVDKKCPVRVRYFPKIGGLCKFWNMSENEKTTGDGGDFFMLKI